MRTRAHLHHGSLRTFPPLLNLRWQDDEEDGGESGGEQDYENLAPELREDFEEMIRKRMKCGLPLPKMRPGRFDEQARKAAEVAEQGGQIEFEVGHLSCVG